jgi:hypothetical protein
MTPEALPPATAPAMFPPTCTEETKMAKIPPDKAARLRAAIAGARSAGTLTAYELHGAANQARQAGGSEQAELAALARLASRNGVDW